MRQMQAVVVNRKGSDATLAILRYQFCLFNEVYSPLTERSNTVAIP